MNIFDFFKEFFSSDLAKNNFLFLIGLLVFVALLAGLAVFWCMRLYYKYQRIKYDQAKQDLETTEEELKTAQAELDALKNKHKELVDAYELLKKESQRTSYKQDYDAYQEVVATDGAELANQV